MQVLQRFPAAHKGVVLWLLDLMADVVEQQESTLTLTLALPSPDP